MPYIVILLSPFLAAPSFLSTFGTLSFFSLIIANLYFYFKMSISAVLPRTIIPMICISFLFIICLIFSVLYHDVASKTINYFFFYVFMISCIIAISFISYTKFIDLKKINKLTLYILIFLFIFAFIEYYYIITNNGYISWVPRFERPDYASNSFSGLYRIRLFTYESSSAGALLNSLYLIFFITTSKSHIKKNTFVLLISFALHLMIFSSTQFVFFMIIIIAQFFSSNLISRKTKIFLLILVLVGIVVASHEVGILINYISNKLDGFITGNASNASASERNKLLLIGVNAFLENPIFGGGLASFYNYVDTGLVNFHLQTLQQLGIFGYLLFLTFLLYPLLFFKQYTLEIKLLFILTWFTLFFSGSIWDSNLYLPYLFIAGKSNER